MGSARAVACPLSRHVHWIGACPISIPVVVLPARLTGERGETWRTLRGFRSA